MACDQEEPNTGQSILLRRGDVAPLDVARQDPCVHGSCQVKVWSWSSPLPDKDSSSSLEPPGHKPRCRIRDTKEARRLQTKLAADHQEMQAGAHTFELREGST